MKKIQFLKADDYMKTITRAKYLDRIIELNGTPDIKIITGIRRSGKSKLMQAYIAYLKSNFENINIIFIDFMDLAYEEIKEYHALHAYVEEHYQEGKTNYLFVDEVQMCPKFELAINSLYSKGKYDIYVTGSDAFLLSADLATLFTGRYIEIHVFPFSFQEYCQYYDDISDKDKLFDEYAIKGGLAGSYAYRTEKDRTNYINEVYETIVTRDLVQKYTLPDTLVLQRLSEFLMDNISNLTVVFFPLVIRNITLPPILSDKKALITLAWDTLWLFLTIFEVCNHSGDREGMRAGYIAAFILMAGVWLVFWVARYLPVNGWIKAGTILIISCIWMAFTNDVYAYFAEHKKQLTILSTHFSDWTNHICVNANVCTLILIFGGIAGGGLLVYGMINRK